MQVWFRLSEAIAFGLRADLDVNKVLDVIGKGAAQSWQLDNRGKTMAVGKFDFGFAVDWMRKDLNLVLEEAQRNGARLPVTALVDQFYADVQAMGGNRWDIKPDSAPALSLQTLVPSRAPFRVIRCPSWRSQAAPAFSSWAAWR